MATDTHEMKMVCNQIRAVYTDSDGEEYLIIDGERINIPAAMPDGWLENHHDDSTPVVDDTP